MHLKPIIASVLTAGLLVGGVGASAAFADSPAPTPSTPPAASTAKGHKVCERAPKVLARIEKAESKLPERIKRLQALDAKWKAAGRNDLAQKVEARIDRLQKREARLPKLASRIEAKCHVAAPAPTS